MGLDFPKVATRAFGHALEGVEVESVGRQGFYIDIHETTAFGIIGVEKEHIVAIAYEESVGVVASEDCLVDVVEHDVGYKQRKGTALRHANLHILIWQAIEEFVDPAELVGVSMFRIMKAATYFRKYLIVLTRFLQGMGIEIITGEVGVQHSHNLRLTFG